MSSFHHVSGFNCICNKVSTLHTELLIMYSIPIIETLYALSSILSQCCPLLFFAIAMRELPGNNKYIYDYQCGETMHPFIGPLKSLSPRISCRENANSEELIFT
jgi:hypothetical protein